MLTIIILTFPNLNATPFPQDQLDEHEEVEEMIRPKKSGIKKAGKGKGKGKKRKVKREEDRSYNAAVMICRAGESPEPGQTQVFRLSGEQQFGNVGDARVAALRFAGSIIDGDVPDLSLAVDKV